MQIINARIPMYMFIQMYTSASVFPVYEEGSCVHIPLSLPTHLLAYSTRSRALHGSWLSMSVLRGANTSTESVILCLQCTHLCRVGVLAAGVIHVVS